MLGSMTFVASRNRSASLVLLGSLTALALGSTACQKNGSGARWTERGQQAEQASPYADADGTEKNWPWTDQTFSPRPASPEDPELEEVVDVCGQGDAALHEVAQLVADSEAETGHTPSLDKVRFHLRRTGSPYVMPRLWSATMKGVGQEELKGHVADWAKTVPPMGEIRCGIGIHRSDDGSQTVSMIQVDALAELQPLPTQVSTGDSVKLKAKFLQPTSAATVVLLPPEGKPRTVDTKLRGDEARAQFSLSSPGTWLVQVMGTQTGGPRPVATALITAGEEPPGNHAAKPVPGERAFDPDLSAPDALFALMNAARKEEGLPLLKRNEKLDEIARAHSDAMLEAGRISHDTGKGDPAFRVAQAGINPKATGENVAMAQSVPRLHRVLWGSPSHRDNLLLRRWDQAGVAISRREDGSLFATQLFLDAR